MATMNYIEFPATDVAATKAFYTAAFDWDWVDDGPDYAAHITGGLEVALNGSGTVAPPRGPGEENGVGPLVLFQTTDLAASEAIVSGAGGSIVSPPYDYPGGRRFHFADPSGNIVGMYQSASD